MSGDLAPSSAPMTQDVQERFEALSSAIDRAGAMLTSLSARIDESLVLTGTLAAENARLRRDSDGLHEANRALWEDRARLSRDNERLRGELGAVRAQLLTLEWDPVDDPPVPE